MKKLKSILIMLSTALMLIIFTSPGVCSDDVLIDENGIRERTAGEYMTHETVGYTLFFRNVIGIEDSLYLIVSLDDNLPGNSPQRFSLKSNLPITVESLDSELSVITSYKYEAIEDESSNEHELVVKAFDINKVIEGHLNYDIPNYYGTNFVRDIFQMGFRDGDTDSEWVISSDFRGVYKIKSSELGVLKLNINLNSEGTEYGAGRYSVEKEYEIQVVQGKLINKTNPLLYYYSGNVNLGDSSELIKKSINKDGNFVIDDEGNILKTNEDKFQGNWKTEFHVYDVALNTFMGKSHWTLPYICLVMKEDSQSSTTKLIKGLITDDEGKIKFPYWALAGLLPFAALPFIRPKNIIIKDLTGSVLAKLRRTPGENIIVDIGAYDKSSLNVMFTHKLVEKLASGSKLTVYDNGVELSSFTIDDVSKTDISCEYTAENKQVSWK